jgi:hypothetical protein
MAKDTFWRLPGRQVGLPRPPGPSLFPASSAAMPLFPRGFSIGHPTRRWARSPERSTMGRRQSLWWLNPAEWYKRAVMELVRLLRYVVLLRFVAVVGVGGVVGDCGMSWAAIRKNKSLGLVSGEMLNEAATRQGFTYFHLSKVSCFRTAFQKTTGVRRSHPIWANQNHSQIPQIMLFRPLKSWTHVQPRIWKYQRWIPKSPIGMLWPPGYRIK